MEHHVNKKESTMQTFAMIQFQIGAWSLNHYGRYETQHLCITAEPANQDDPNFGRKIEVDAEHKWFNVELGSLAPLMGLAEDMGELVAALEEISEFVATQKKEEGAEITIPSEFFRNMENALGGIIIHLCDYCCRENTKLPERVALAVRDRAPSGVGLITHLGKLFRCHRKRHEEVLTTKDFDAIHMEALRGFVWHLETCAKEYTSSNLLIILNQAWRKMALKLAEKSIDE